MVIFHFYFIGFRTFRRKNVILASNVKFFVDFNNFDLHATLGQEDIIAKEEVSKYDSSRLHIDIIAVIGVQDSLNP